MVLKQAILFSTIPARKPGQLLCTNQVLYRVEDCIIGPHSSPLTSCPWPWTFQHFPLTAEGGKICPSYPVSSREIRDSHSKCGSNLQIAVKLSWAQFSSAGTQLSPSYNSGKGINYRFKPLNFPVACPWNTTVETVAQCIYDLKKLHNSGVGIIAPILH